jgi:ankyrin repeat protein
MNKKLLKFLIKHRIKLGLGDDFIQWLLNPINAASMARNKRTLVHELVSRNHIEALEELLNKSDELLLDSKFWYATDNMGRTIGHEAILLLHDFQSYFTLGNLPDSSHKLGMFNCLIKYSNYFSPEFWSVWDSNGETLGHLAVKADSIEIIKALQMLLGTGYWRLTDTRGMTPVHAAVQNNRMNLFEFFINNGEAFGFDERFWRSITAEGYTLAHLAAGNSDVTNFFLLLANYKALGLDNSFWQIKTVAGNTIAHELFAKNHGSAKFPVTDHECEIKDLDLHNKVLMLKRMVEESDALCLDNEFWCAVNNNNANVAHLAVTIHARMALDVLVYMHNKMELGDDFWYTQDKRGSSPISAMLYLDPATGQLRQGFHKNSYYYVSILLKLAKIFPLDNHLQYFGQSSSFEPLAVQYILFSELTNSFPGVLVYKISDYLYAGAIADNTGMIYNKLVLDEVSQQNKDDQRRALPSPVKRLCVQERVGRAVYRNLKYNIDSELADIDKNPQSMLSTRAEPSKAVQPLETWKSFQHKLKISMYFENYVGDKNRQLLNKLLDVYSGTVALPQNRGLKRPRDAENQAREGGLGSHQLQLSRIHHLLSRLISALADHLPISPQVPVGYVDVPGDGLCFFHAVAAQLLGKLSAQQLQQMAIDEVLNHPGRYGEFAHGGLEAFLNYHLQRQESVKGGWADNVMMQALANAIGYVVEVQLFDLQGNALEADPVRIVPHNNVAEARVLRLGNIENLHFVAGALNNAPQEEQEVEDDGGVSSSFGSDGYDYMLISSNSASSDGENSTLQEYNDADAILGPAGVITGFSEEQKHNWDS